MYLGTKCQALMSSIFSGNLCLWSQCLGCFTSQLSTWRLATGNVCPPSQCEGCHSQDHGQEDSTKDGCSRVDRLGAGWLLHILHCQVPVVFPTKRVRGVLVGTRALALGEQFWVEAPLFFAGGLQLDGSQDNIHLFLVGAYIPLRSHYAASVAP